MVVKIKLKYMPNEDKNRCYKACYLYLIGFDLLIKVKVNFQNVILMKVVEYLGLYTGYLE